MIRLDSFYRPLGVLFIDKLKVSGMAIKSHTYYVYILTNKNNRVLYTGITNSLTRRCREHKEKKTSGFTKKYNVDKLIYYEVFGCVKNAIRREKQIKGYSRTKKDALIDKCNPNWKALFVDGIVKKIGC